MKIENKKHDVSFSTTFLWGDVEYSKRKTNSHLFVACKHFFKIFILFKAF